MFPLLTLTGAPIARGQQHGSQQRARVLHSIASYARIFAYFRGMPWDAVQRAAEAYIPVLATRTPDLLDEMRGIAAGAGLALNEIVALNVRTELLAGAFGRGRHPDHMDVMRANIALGVPQHPVEPLATGAMRDALAECTTIAALPAAASGKTWLAQNWDWSGDQRAACVLLRISEPGAPDILTLTEAGIVGKIGINSAGLAVTLNILSSRLDGLQPAMAVHVLLRRLMACASIAEAVDVAQAMPCAASSCITLADAGGNAVALEITPAAVGELRPTDGVLTHTNHCVTAPALADASEPLATSSTHPRYDTASALLDAQRGAITRESLMNILRDESQGVMSICRQPDMRLHPCDRVESVAGVVMDIDERVMWVADDVPSRVAFAPLPVSEFQPQPKRPVT